MTVSESRVWDEGLPHPAIKINKPHRSPKHTRGVGEIRIDCLVSWKFEASRPGERRPFQRRERAFASSRYVVPPAKFVVLLVLLSACVPGCGNHTD